MHGLHARRALRTPAAGLRARTSVCCCASGNHYQTLGVEVNAGEEQIKAAFRRRAKELHPDVCRDDDAEAQFMVAKEAYETLSDPGRRGEYDTAHGIRRLGFFRDVGEPRPAGSAFGWDASPSPSDPFERHRREWADAPNPFRPDDDSGPGPSTPSDPAEFLEQLQRFMSGGGGGPSPMRQWAGGRQADPWGTSTSEAWHRRVEQQRSDPQFGRGPGGGYGRGGEEGGPPEWQPYRPDDDAGGGADRGGWRRPGEWRSPRPSYDDRDGGEGRPKKGPSIGGDDFRRGIGL